MLECFLTMRTETGHCKCCYSQNRFTIWNTGRCFRIKRHKQKLRWLGEKVLKGTQQQRAGMWLGPHEVLSCAEKAKSQKEKQKQSWGQQGLSYWDACIAAERHRSQEALSTVQQEIRTTVRDARYNETTTTCCVGSERHPHRYTQRHASKRFKIDSTGALFF